MRFFIFSCCALGCLYQVYDAACEYMGYFTRTRTTRDSLDQQAMPGIGFCVSHLLPEYGSMTILQRLLATPRFDERASYCRLRHPRTLSLVDCNSTSRSADYIDGALRCYSLFEQRLLKGDELWYNRSSREYASLDMNVTVHAFRSLTLLLAFPHDEPFNMKRGSHNKVWLEGIGAVTFTVGVEESIVLPPPYASRCFDFRSTSFKTRGVALDKCLLQTYVLNGTHYIPFLTFVSRDSSVKDLMVNLVDRELERTLVQQAMAKCDASLGEDDCRSVNVRLIPVALQLAVRGQTWIRMTLSGLASHRLVTQMQPVTGLLDLINWIGSICGLWFGIHVFGSCSSFSDCLFRCRGLTSPPKSSKKAANIKILRFSRLLLMTAAVLTASWQVSDVLRIYFEHPFKWNYYTKLQQYVSLPTIVLCTDRTIDADKAKNLFPDVLNGSNGSNGEDWDRRLSVEQQLEASVSDQEFFFLDSSKMVTRHTLAYERIDGHFFFKKYINDQFVCFKTFANDTRVNDSVPLPEYKRGLMEMLQNANLDIRLQMDKFHSVRMVAQFETGFAVSGSAKLLPGSRQNLMFPVSPNEKLLVDKYVVYHRITKRFFYADHHKASCFPYKARLGSDRALFVENCVKSSVAELVSSRRGYWPRKMFFNRNIARFNISMVRGQPLFFSDNDGDLHKIRAACDRKFKLRDCEETFTELMIEDVMIKGLNQTLMIVLYPPGRGYIEVRQNLRFSVLGLFGFVGGIINCWIGCAIIDLRFLLKIADARLTRFQDNREKARASLSLSFQRKTRQTISKSDFRCPSAPPAAHVSSL